MQLKKSSIKTATKRGDTIIEVIFAFAVFCMVAIISIAMMNMGIAVSERSLELVTARNELNAQAEALRFVHSSYVAEMSLPLCNGTDGPEVKCQQYRDLWLAITDRSVDADDFTITYPPEVTGSISTCGQFYTDNYLYDNNAFVLNTRQLLAQHNSNGGMSYRDTDALIPAGHYDASATNNVFVPAILNARMIYTDDPTSDDWEENNSTTEMQSLFNYTRVAKVEGIWVVAVKGPDTGTPSVPRYYDFYIETCWYGSGNSYPTALDTIIRLYNPQGAAN